MTTCPGTTTPEPFCVEPIISPTDLLTQTISIYSYHTDAITITAESGVFTGITITLLPNTVHHLHVEVHIETIHNGECQCGNYTLSTSYDHDGNPLIIVQGNGSGTPPPTITPSPTSAPHPDAYLPVILKSDDAFTPTLTSTAANSLGCLIITPTVGLPFNTRLLNTPIPTCTFTPTASPSNTPNRFVTEIIASP
jgi:hypothetical protein